MGNSLVKVHVDQLGDVMVTVPIATKIWLHTSHEYASGLFSTHVTLNSNLTVHRFVDEHMFELLSFLQSMQNYYNKAEEQEQAREQAELDILQSKYNC